MKTLLLTSSLFALMLQSQGASAAEQFQDICQDAVVKIGSGQTVVSFTPFDGNGLVKEAKARTSFEISQAFNVGSGISENKDLWQKQAQVKTVAPFGTRGESNVFVVDFTVNMKNKTSDAVLTISTLCYETESAFSTP